MGKPADVAHPIHDVLRRRWSPRAFSERTVEPEQLQSLFEAARWAPSSNNEHPWHFIPVAMIAVGYSCDPAILDDKLRRMRSHRAKGSR